MINVNIGLEELGDDFDVSTIRRPDQARSVVAILAVDIRAIL